MQEVQITQPFTKEDISNEDRNYLADGIFLLERLLYGFLLVIGELTIFTKLTGRHILPFVHSYQSHCVEFPTFLSNSLFIQALSNLGLKDQHVAINSSV